jgi:cholecystokinin A receptor/hypocretin (orexin) receptor 2
MTFFHLIIGIRNEFLCKFYGFLSTHVLYSTLLITTIAFDRYFCICWPLYKIITIRRARIIVIVCGFLSSLLGCFLF